MVRPLTGERAKKPTSISLDPEVWKVFKKLVEAKQPDGDESASAHTETLMRAEIAKLRGSGDAEAEASERSLQKQAALLERKINRLNERINEDFQARGDKILDAYKLNDNFSNVKQVVRDMLLDWHRGGEDALIRTLTLSELNFMVEYLKVQAEKIKVDAQLFDLMLKQEGVTDAELQEASAKPAPDFEAENKRRLAKLAEISAHNRRVAEQERENKTDEEEYADEALLEHQLYEEDESDW